MSGETRFVILLVTGLVALVGAMLAAQARHRAALRRAEPLVLRVPAPPNLRQVAVVAVWFLGVTLIGILGLVAALHAGSPLAPTLSLGIVGIAGVAVTLAVRAERRFSSGRLEMSQQSLRILVNVEGDMKEISIDLRQPFTMERSFCPHATGNGAIMARVDHGERSLYLWYPARLAELHAASFSPEPMTELRGLYLGADGEEVIRRLQERLCRRRVESVEI